MRVTRGSMFIFLPRRASMWGRQREARALLRGAQDVSGVMIVHAGPHLGQKNHLVYGRARRNVPNFLLRHETPHQLRDPGLAQDMGVVDDLLGWERADDLLGPAQIFMERLHHLDGEGDTHDSRAEPDGNNNRKVIHRRSEKLRVCVRVQEPIRLTPLRQALFCTVSDRLCADNHDEVPPILLGRGGGWGANAPAQRPRPA